MRRLGAVAATLLVAGCSAGGADEPARSAPSSIVVSSTAFGDGQPIPVRYSCRGDNVSPPLRWSGLPSDTREVALVVDDPDAPRGTFVHWIVAGLSPSLTGLAEGVVPPGAVQARNSAGRAAYTGPCPPSGTHHYRFTVYALRSASGVRTGAGTDDALSAIDAAALARGRLTGIFAA